MPHTEGEWRINQRAGCQKDEANAQLIAAAPDLLEAAQKIDNCMAKIRQPQFHRFAHANDVLVNALGDLHKAIAKATGEETTK